MEPEYIEGLIIEIIYQNPTNGYTVCDIDCDGVINTAVGYMPGLSVGETARMSGAWTEHPEYGTQFRVDYFEKVAPSGEGAILLYLSSGIISGVRESTARKIVDKFKEKALDVIATEPEKLATIKGISLDKARKINKSYLEKQGAQNVVMFLAPYGVTPELCMRIYQSLGANAVTRIKANPYVLCEISGVGFPAADKIAMALSTEKNHPGRISAAIKFVLSQVAVTMGHTYLVHEELLEYTKQVLGTEDEFEIENQLVVLQNTKQIKASKTYEGQSRYSLSVYDRAENVIAKKLAELNYVRTSHKKAIQEGIEKTELQDGITLSEEQTEAVFSAAVQGVLVITGGPGTGKTTIIKTITNIMKKQGAKIALAAPTGRAAKRMADACGEEAMTIHRLLEAGYSHDEEASVFMRDATNPIDADCVIIDEMSMVDVLLMGSLASAIKRGAQLILVGDADQLPPVGAGNVLKDIIRSELVRVVRLAHIYRQAAKSMIVQNAHRINAGKKPLLNQKASDFYFIQRQTLTEIVTTVTELCAKRLFKAYGFKAQDIQVLSPVKKTPAGVIVLNEQLQNAINPPAENKKEKKFGAYLLREGDKVMQTKNNYDLVWQKGTEQGAGVYNGDMGTVIKISPSGMTVTVLFDDGREAIYDHTQAAELDLSYAITVHKSQGNEFDCVVMPVFSCAPRLMTRNLFYTALTRAKKLVVLVGSKEAIGIMVNNNDQTKRNSGLHEKLTAQE